MKLELRDRWTVRAVGGPVPGELADRDIPAEVPGSVHLDLLRAGAIPDPYLAENEAALSWIGHVDWLYTTTFDWAPTDDDVVELVLAGLDTVATVSLNGVVVARTANMHRSYRVDVTAVVETGRNTLEVWFRAGYEAVHEAERVVGHRPYISEHPFNALRTMACNYGWDWGPALITCGLWRPASVQAWSTARLASVRPLVSLAGADGRLDAHVEVTRAGPMVDGLTVTVSVGGALREEPVVDDRVHVPVDVPDVRRWWPVGQGDQPLYDVTVELRHHGAVLDSWAGRVGFRIVDVDTTPDVAGTPFTVRVNGKPLFAKGFNWIPDDCFPPRVRRPDYAARLTQARDANANLIRVWGGGIYESDDFYDLCDELGLLVWQDFPFACAAYSEAEPLWSEVEAEAREHVARLSPHPSLAMWNGCNENLWGYRDWGWEQELGGTDWGLGYYTRLLPAVVAELDPTRPYTPGSPYSPDPADHPDDPAHGTTHIWDVWNEKDYRVYGEYRPRFVSEFGFQGPATWTTLTRAVPDDPLTPTSSGMLAHQKAEDGQGKLARGLVGHLPEPSTVEDWHFLTSVNQARAVSFGVEHFRALWPYCAGAVVWQLNDCWPTISWAVVDGDGRRKPVWYALRRSFADRLLTVQPRDGAPAVVAVNDADEEWTGALVVVRSSFDGTTLAEEKLALRVAPRSTATLALTEPLARPGDARAELLRATAGDARAEYLYRPDVAAALPPPEYDLAVERAGGGYRLTVTARTLLRDVCLLADRLAPDAEVDEQLVTLLPGESRVFVVTTATDLPPEAFGDPLVLRCVNQVTGRAAGGPTG